MPYSSHDHDRALARLMADVDRTPQRTQPQPTAGVAIGLALLFGIIALCALFALSGCNTIAGAAADLEAAARGTRHYLADQEKEE